MIRKLLVEHPASVGESYFVHMRHSLAFAGAMLAAGLACLVHALIPGLHRTTGSDTVRRLHDRMVVNRRSLS